LPIGSSLNNFSIVELKKKIQDSVNKQKGKNPTLKLQSSKPEKIPLLDTRALTIQSPSNSPFRNDVRGAFTKNFNYRMEFTKGHYERTFLQNIKDPFKLNYLSFETTR